MKFDINNLKCPPYRNPPASMKKLSLPNDIINEARPRQIVDLIGNKFPWDRTVLKNLTLVDQAFGAFATERLFKDWDTFNLGNCFEDILVRGQALQRSYLRSRVKNLRVSVKSVLPQEVVREIERTYNLDGAMNMKLHNRPAVEACMDGFCAAVEQALGPDMRLEGLILDFAASDVMYAAQNHWSMARELDVTRPARLLRVAWFRNCLIDMIQLPQFSRVRSLRTEVWRYGPRDTLAHYDDYDRGQGVLPGLEDPEGSRQLVDKFWLAVNRLDLEVLDIHSCVNDWFDPSDFTAIGQMARRSGTKRLNLRSLDFLALFQPGEESPSRLEAFRVEDGHGYTELGYGSTIAMMTNLRSLELIHVQLNKEYTTIAIEIRGFLGKLPSLTYIRFVALGYHRTKLTDSRRVCDPATGERYFLPLYSSLEVDIEAFSKLRTEVEDRREEKGLEKDLWLSVFCVREDVLRMEVKDTGYESERDSDYDLEGWDSEQEHDEQEDRSEDT